ncbi:hypothetical protein VCRA2119O147_690005 [Vibrio crassostreae]|nr:hypothetical protein VCRA2113O351_200039 [Vibrio crassostreae]CAK1910685.1 hypothetical protein VCRA2117O378_230044 [Vibrio crassostreae]CAK1920209.1 hypothetical protein VCRA2115O371_230039 [Vibrio crassostreae]CAK1938231.1 hypothetical protein VCRA2113O326_200039 [Vibrio crassostreae]CAK1947159.1 hypothetical protein VCRA2113O138_260041 [Vibrio crassostreae]
MFSYHTRCIALKQSHFLLSLYLPSLHIIEKLRDNNCDKHGVICSRVDVN